MARRLPVYLLLDCSGSMSGEPIESVRKGVETLQDTLLNNPMAMDTAYLSVITFSSTAKVAVPLTSLFSFQPPKISAGGLTAMGAALELLADSVESDVKRKKSEQERGDYRPLVFLFTDGYPTDDEVFDTAAQRVKNMKWGKFVACAAGPNPAVETLCKAMKEGEDNILWMKDMTPAALEAFFEWVSGSIASSVTPEGKEPPLPRGVNLIKPPRQK